MPILGPVGARTPARRILAFVLYTALIAGGVTMVYPFALMVATSLTTETDAHDFRLIPRFIRDDSALFCKYLEAKYARAAGVQKVKVTVATLSLVYDADAESGVPVLGFTPDLIPFVRDLPADKRDILLRHRHALARHIESVRTDGQVRALLSDWTVFRSGLYDEVPQYFRTFFLGLPDYKPLRNVVGESTERYRADMKARYGGDLAAYNEATGESLQRGFFEILPVYEEHWSSRWVPPMHDPQYVDWLAWRADLPERFVTVFPSEPAWHQYLQSRPEFRPPRPEAGAAVPVQRKLIIDMINEAWGTSYAAVSDIPLTRRAPEGESRRRAWATFVRSRMNVMYWRLGGEGTGAYHAYLAGRYGLIDRYNAAHETAFSSYEELALPEQVLSVSGLSQADLIDFVRRAEDKGGCPLVALSVDTPEVLYRDFLAERYGDVSAVNAAYGWSASAIDRIDLPIPELDWYHMTAEKGYLRRWFLSRNYRITWDFLAGHGRALVNTAVLCGGAVLFALTVNPLCAYALSRYNLPYAGRIIIFLLATMAFPPSVAMIPNFLLLRNLHMLNTYWALLLPGVGNGFMVFMMKGFFDTLPREIFEAARIDGASEMRSFFQILIPLCRPVFAFFALGAFTGAYGGFMWAFTICPDERMWTLMVFLYQLQAVQPFGVQMAALVIAALPTLAVFTVVQNIILRGIVLPSFH